MEPMQLELERESASLSSSAAHDAAATAAYLFCVCGWGTMPTAGEEGLAAGVPLCLVAHREVAALWCRVPLGDWCGPGGERNLRDLTWVSPRASRHHEVLTIAMRHAPVYPVRFGTLFSSPERIHEMLERNYIMLVNYLRYVEDKEEWSVKLFAQTAGRTGDSGAGAVPREAGRGAAYLRGKAAAGRMAEQVWAVIERDAAGTLTELEEYAVVTQPRRLQPREVTAGSVDMVRHSAFLLARNRREEFLQAVERVNALRARTHLVCEVSGPWPPYAFTDLAAGCQ